MMRLFRMALSMDLIFRMTKRLKGLDRTNVPLVWIDPVVDKAQVTTIGQFCERTYFLVSCRTAARRSESAVPALRFPAAPN